MVSFSTTGLLLHVALFRLGTTHDCAIGQAGPSIWSRLPASHSQSGCPVRMIGLAVVLALNLILSPVVAAAQQPGRVPRIGYLVLSPLVDPPSAERAAFLDGLKELGYVAGQNIIIEYRSAAWSRELLPDLAAELVELKVDVIVAVPGTADAA